MNIQLKITIISAVTAIIAYIMNYLSTDQPVKYICAWVIYLACVIFLISFVLFIWAL